MNRLEAVAKAMGASYQWDEAGQALWIDVSEANPRGRDFNPETDPADCFRAMMDGNILVINMWSSPLVSCVGWFERAKESKTFWEEYPNRDGNKLAATMKAICDCLEQIGREMESDNGS